MTKAHEIAITVFCDILQIKAPTLDEFIKGVNTNLRNGNGHGLGKHYTLLDNIEAPSDYDYIEALIAYSERFKTGDEEFKKNPTKERLCLAYALIKKCITPHQTLECLIRLQNSLFPRKSLLRFKQKHAPSTRFIQLTNAIQETEALVYAINQKEEPEEREPGETVESTPTLQTTISYTEILPTPKIDQASQTEKNQPQRNWKRLLLAGVFFVIGAALLGTGLGGIMTIPLVVIGVFFMVSASGAYHAKATQSSQIVPITSTDALLARQYHIKPSSHKTIACEPMSQTTMNREESADKPGSVVDSHSSGMVVTNHLKQPTRTYSVGHTV